MTHDNKRYDKQDAEAIEWLMDWRDDLFSPSYDRNGWPIEMHGMAMDVERLLAEKYRVECCPTCRGVFEHVLGCPEQDKAR